MHPFSGFESYLSNFTPGIYVNFVPS